MNMKEELQKYAIMLTHLFYRNGYIEDLHSDSSKNLSESDMKTLNKDICDRIYTHLLAEFIRDDKLYNNLTKSSWLFGDNWDLPEIKEDMLMKKDLKKLKEFENSLD